MNDEQYMKAQSEIQEGMQSRLAEESRQNQSRLVAPQLRQEMAESQAAVIAQTNPAKALKVILEGFRGKIEDDQGTYTQIAKPLMNEKGISKIASMLIPFINDPIRFGHIGRKEVRDLTLQIADDITEDIGLNWREYGILDPSVKDIVVDSLVTLIFITLTRSEEGGEKRFLSSVILESVGNKQGTRKKESQWQKYFGM